MALAAQLDASRDPVLASGAVEAFTSLSRAETNVIFGQAGHLVHYGAGNEPLEKLIHLISAVQRTGTSGDAVVRPGEEVRLVGEIPQSLAGYDETWLRDTVFVVRYVGRDATVDAQPDLAEDYVIVTVPATAVSPCGDRTSRTEPTG